MFVHYSCTCGMAFRITKADPDVGLLSLKMNCPGIDCSKEIQIIDAEEASELDLQSLPAKALYVACMGRGFPEERCCSPEALKRLLVGGLISDIDLAPCSADEDRSIISSIQVDSMHGIHLIHFAVSTQGATIYKVTEQ